MNRRKKTNTKRYIFLVGYTKENNFIPSRTCFNISQAVKHGIVLSIMKSEYNIDIYKQEIARLGALKENTLQYVKQITLTDILD